MGTYLEHFTDFVAFLIVEMVLVFAIVSKLVLTRPSREDLSGYVIVFSIISGVIISTVDVCSRGLAVVLVGNLGSFVLRRVVLVRVCNTIRLSRAAMIICWPCQR